MGSLINAQDSNALIAQIYDSVMAPNGFQGFIENLIYKFQLKSVSMLIRHVETNEVKSIWNLGVPKEWFNTYMLEYAKDDVLAHYIAASPLAEFYASNLDVVQSEDFTETRFFKEWIIPQGVVCAAGAVVLNEGGWLTQIIVQRGHQHSLFTREELHQLNQLIPHIRKAVQMRQRFAELQVNQNFLAGGFDVLAMPTFLFDENGMVVHCNKSATMLLNSQNLLWLQGKYLRTQDRETTNQLNLELTYAISASRGENIELNGVLLLPRPGLLPLMLIISPLQPTGASSNLGGALVFAFDPTAAPDVTEDLVCRLFCLTKCEAKLAVALCSGKTLDEAAKDYGVTIHTVKTQLKSCFLKTGAKRQSELVSLLLSSPAYFLALKS